MKIGMTQLYSPSKLDFKHQQVYCYVNHFKKVVVAKVVGLKNRQCQRVVFPQEKFLFLADDNCDLEIIQQSKIGIIKDTIACSQLQVEESI